MGNSARPHRGDDPLTSHSVHRGQDQSRTHLSKQANRAFQVRIANLRIANCDFQPFPTRP